MRFVACSFPDDFGVVHAERARQEQQSIFRTGVAGMNVVLPFWGVVSPLLFLLWEFPPFLCVSLSLICFSVFAVLGSLFFRFLPVLFSPRSPPFFPHFHQISCPLFLVSLSNSLKPQNTGRHHCLEKDWGEPLCKKPISFRRPPTGKPPPRMNPSTASSETAA